MEQQLLQALLLAIAAARLAAFPSRHPTHAHDEHEHQPHCNESCEGPSGECTFCRRSGMLLLHLQGPDLEEMGANYGFVLRKELAESYDLLKGHFEDENVMYLEALLFHRRYSSVYRPFLKGVARGSGLPIRKVIILNAMETITKGAQTTPPGSLKSACLFASVPPEWTEHNKSLLLRNYDFPTPFDLIAKNLVVTVLKHQDKLPTAVIGMPGQMYCPTCLNSQGLFLELNNGMPSGGFDVNYKRKSLLINMLEFMQEAEDIQDLSRSLRAAQSDYSLILNAGSPTGVASHEYSSTNGTQEVEGLSITEPFVSTNFFLSPAWGLPPPDSISSWFAPVRRNNMFKLLRKDRGRHSISSAEKLMDVDMKSGGSAWALTVYQLIYEPTSRRLAIRANAPPATWAHFPLANWL